MKKIIWFSLVILLSAASLTGCSYANPQSTDQMKIGVTVYDQYDTFIESLMNDFTDYAVEKESETGIVINIEVCNAAGRQSTQNEQVSTMIQNGCDIICVNLVDRTEPAAIIDMAQQNDIPIIFFNRELVAEDLERWDKLYYIGAEAFVSGILEGELAADAWTEHPESDRNQDGICQYVVLEGEAGHQDSIVRTEYSVRTLEEAGIALEKLSYAIANWNRAQAQTKMCQILDDCGDRIEMIIANNDDMALGAIDAYKAAKIPQQQWPLIFGIDGTEVGLEAVRKGEMQGTVYNDGEGQAKAMLDLAFAISTDSDLSDLNLENGKYIRLPYEKVV